MTFLNCEASDELGALTAIYADSLSVADPEMIGDADGSGMLGVLVRYREESFTARFELTLGYPETELPKLSLQLRVRNEKLSKEIVGAVMRLFSAERVNVVLFPAIELVRSMMIDNGANECQGFCNKHTDTLVDIEAISEPIGVGMSMGASAEDKISVAPLLPPIFHGDPILEKGSTFVGHCARVSSMQDVLSFREVLLSEKKVRLRMRCLEKFNLNQFLQIAKATHNIFAYRFTDAVSGICCHDNDDDGETAAGSRLGEILRLMGADGVAVVVTRWFGGTLLGPDRFRLINNCARQVIETWLPDCITSSVTIRTLTKDASRMNRANAKSRINS